MALDVVIRDPSSGVGQKTNASGDTYNTSAKATQVLGGETTRPNDVSHSMVFYEQDSGTITGARYFKSPVITEDSRMSVGLDTPMFEYTFNATAQDTGNWAYTSTTMTMSQSGGFLLCNANNTNTATTGCNYVSKRYFPLIGNAGLHMEFTGSITSAALANEVFLAGLGVPASATASPSDGIWFQYTSAGLIGVLNYNGNVTQTGVLISSITPNVNGQFKIVITERAIEFWINGILAADQACPAGQSQGFLTNALPAFIQYYNSGTVTGASMQVKVGDIHIDQLDSNLNKAYGDQQASKGLKPHQGLSGGTMGTTVGNGGNSVAIPAGTAGSNTAANVTGFGGFGSMTAPAGGATDYILCSYQVPIGSVSQTPRTFYITGLNASFINNGAAVATTATSIMLGLAWGHTAVSLATAESGSFVSPTTKSPRRRWIGSCYAPIGTVIGQTYNTSIITDFKSSIVVHPGEFIAAIIKVPVGTATASQTILWVIDFEGYVE